MPSTSSKVQTSLACCAPKGSSTARSRVTAETMRTAWSGHHATASPPLPSCQVCMQRPVATCHTRAVPSRDADASHCPLASTATLVTCKHQPSRHLGVLHTSQRLQSRCLQQATVNDVPHINCFAAHMGSVASEALGEARREGLQVTRLGQRGQQRLGVVDVHTALPHAGAQVQVQAPVRE